MEKTIKVRCDTCDGTGQKTEWSEKLDRRQRQKWLVKDCPDCDGTEKVDLVVMDNRKKTIKKAIVVPYKA